MQRKGFGLWIKTSVKLWEDMGESVGLFFNFEKPLMCPHYMPQFIGEFECKMDGKGRVMLPASLRKQIPEEAGDKLVVNRGFDKCLTLYTKADWQKETEKLNGLNSFNKKDRLFIRLFNNGATEVQIDGASRILVPKKLQEYAEIENELVLYAYENKIEIWSAKNYDEMFDMGADDFSELAEEVMSRKKGKEGGDDE